MPTGFSLSRVLLVVFAPIAFIAGGGVAAEEEAARMEIDANRFHLDSGDRTILRYRFGDVGFKPYVEELFTPSGRNILRDAPSDHLHHHALMFAWKVDGVNFWEEQTAPGVQEHLKVETFTHGDSGSEEAGLVQHLQWLTPDRATVLLLERRTLVARLNPESPFTLLSWTSEFTLPKGKPSAEITGAHYHGLGMRFLESMDKDGVFRNADGEAGEVVRGDERLARSRWCAYTAKADGEPVTAAMFEHPQNPRSPAWWFTMQTPFAYLSATLNLHREPMHLKAGEILRLRYGVAVWDGEADEVALEAAWQDWVRRVNESD